VPVSAVARRGVVRLLNTSGGRVLVLAGDVDAAAVEAFRRCYGAEPVRVDAVDARSVTALSPSGRELLTDTLQWAERTGRPVTLRSCPTVARALTAAR
jgi:L-alanine-DL-glutamate epimerase-like enolase superfamily enzyme